MTPINPGIVPSTNEERQGRRPVAGPPEAAADRRDDPLEESQKSYHTILEQQVTEATEELERPAAGLMLSGLTDGLDLGFGPFAMVVFSTLTATVFSEPIRKLLGANFYAAGFVFVVMSHSALFTEHTTSAVQPVLAGRSTVGRLLRLWGLVLAANLVGAAAFAWAASRVGPGLGVADPKAMGELAGTLVGHSSGLIFVSAIGAGWLMGLLSWLTSAARDSISQLVLVWLTTYVIGLASLHHSIAGTTEVLMGVFVGQGAGVADFFRFLIWSVLGNAIGGSVFVAALKSGHVRQSKG